MSIQPLTRTRAHGTFPDTAASQVAHGQLVWANQVVRSRLWDATCWDGLWDHLGPASQTGCRTMGIVKLVPWSATGWFSKLCWEQWGSGPPKHPDYLKHPYVGGRLKVKLWSPDSWQWSSPGMAANITWAEISSEGLSLKAPPKERRGETHFWQLLSHSSLAQAHAVVSKGSTKIRHPGPGKEVEWKEVIHRALTSSVALALETAGYKLLCKMALPFWKQVCQCWHCTWKVQHSMCMLRCLTSHCLWKLNWAWPKTVWLCRSQICIAQTIPKDEQITLNKLSIFAHNKSLMLSTCRWIPLREICNSNTLKKSRSPSFFRGIA